jgi:hypothetical protein
MLDYLAYKVRMKCDKPKKDDNKLVDKSLGKIHELWRHW